MPIDVLAVDTSVWRAGRKVQRLEATLASGGRQICRAFAIAMRLAPLELPPPPDEDPGPPAPPPPLEACPPFSFTFFREAVGYQTAMEARLASGVWGRGATAMWMRARVPLVPGEAMSPLQRVMVAADSGNGIAVVLDPRRFFFMNADLTVYLHRPLEGEWVCLDARTTVDPDGVGLTESRLWDRRGRIGRGLQSLLLEPRP